MYIYIFCWTAKANQTIKVNEGGNDLIFINQMENCHRSAVYQSFDWWNVNESICKKHFKFEIGTFYLSKWILSRQALANCSLSFFFSVFRAPRVIIYISFVLQPVHLCFWCLMVSEPALVSLAVVFFFDKLHNLPIQMRAQQIYIFLWKNRDENFRMKQMAFEVVPSFALFPQELWPTTKDSQIFSYINGNVCVWTRTCQENIQTIFGT